MATDVLSALEFDKDILNGNIILVKENSGCEAHFVVSCLMAKQAKENGATCLLHLHNDFTHYHHIGLKMGYNIKSLKEIGSFENIDCLELICKSAKKEDIEIDLMNDNTSTYGLFEIVKKSFTNLHSKHNSVCIVIDDLTHLLSLGFEINDVNMFVQLCRSLILENKECSLVIGVHVISGTDTSHTLSGLIAHLADVVCEISGLQTGPSRDISGSMKISRPWTNSSVSEASTKLTKLENYHYKLFDRGVKVFAPGIGNY